MIRPGIEFRSPGPLANSLLIRPMAQSANYDFCLIELFEIELFDHLDVFYQMTDV